MDFTPVIHTARTFILEGETGKALQFLQERLPAGTLHAFNLIHSNYFRIRQMEQKGVMNALEVRQAYSQVNDALLAALDDLEAGRLPGRTHPFRRWAIAGLIVVLAIVAGVFLLRRGAADCPDFTGTGPRILILPFQNVIAGNDVKAEALVQSRISEFSGNNNFPLEVKIREATTNLHPDIQEARQLGSHCGADLVVWGLYDPSKDTAFQATVSYVFTGKDGRSGGTGFQTFRRITDLQSGHMLKSLDDAVLALCGVMAIHENNLVLAKKWFGKIKTPDEQDLKIRDQLGR
jgi:hypothetical protein